jgi:hypothetical protein
MLRRRDAAWTEHLVTLYEKKQGQLDTKNELVSLLMRMGTTGPDAEIITEEIISEEVSPAQQHVMGYQLVYNPQTGGTSGCSSSSSRRPPASTL